MTTTSQPRTRSRRETRKAAAERATARGRGTLQPTTGLDLTGHETTGRLRVAVYIRISTDEEHQPFSLEAQETKLVSYIGTQPGWELAGPVYRDEKSGATLQRPALQRALAAAQAGRFDVLLVYRVDRLSRSLRELVEILDQLDGAGVAFRSATEPVDTSTAVGRMLVQMLGVFAQFERETIIDRVVNGMERKAAKGEWCGGYRPHGYELDRPSGKLAPVEAEAAVPPQVFDLYVNHRLGARSLAGRLNQNGHRTKAGKPFNADAGPTILRNRVYLGEVYFRGTWYRAEGHHKPLVDPDLFEQAQQILIARGEDHAKRGHVNSDYTLAGTITCSRCGKRYVGAAATGNLYRYRYRYYTCFTRHRYGTNACQAERLPADQLEQAVLNAMIDTYRRTDLIHQAVTAAASSAQSIHGAHRAELHTIDAELTTLDARTDRLLTAIENGLNQTDAIERITANRHQATQLRQRREELTDLIATAPAGPTAEQLATITAAIREAIDQAETGTAKRILESLVHGIRVASRADITPYFRIPADGTNYTSRRFAHRRDRCPRRVTPNIGTTHHLRQRRNNNHDRRHLAVTATPPLREPPIASPTGLRDHSPQGSPARRCCRRSWPAPRAAPLVAPGLHLLAVRLSRWR
jgi:site-specific DNA recombinase